jgi:isopentenyldiphosphate isomerase
LNVKKYNACEAESNEWVPVVNEAGIVISKALRSKVHNGSKMLHPVVHMHILNDENSLLLQKRPQSKFIQSGKWDTAVGGHVSFNESIEAALKKEAFEETGLENFEAEFLEMYIWESDVEAELVYLFLTRTQDNFKATIPAGEVEEVRSWTKQEIENQLSAGIFTPNFVHEFKMLKKYNRI